MPTISEPSTKLSEENLCRFDLMLIRGQIGESTYLRSLFIVGLLPDEARTRLKLLTMSEDWKNRKVSQ